MRYLAGVNRHKENQSRVLAHQSLNVPLTFLLAVLSCLPPEPNVAGLYALPLSAGGFSHRK